MKRFKQALLAVNKICYHSLEIELLDFQLAVLRLRRYLRARRIRMLERALERSRRRRA